MHMADALISPAVGGAMWVAAGVAITYSARKVRDELTGRIGYQGDPNTGELPIALKNGFTPGLICRERDRSHHQTAKKPSGAAHVPSPLRRGCSIGRAKQSLSVS